MEKSKYKLKRHAQFNLSTAMEYVNYSLWEYRPAGLFRKWKWCRVTEWHFDEGGGSRYPVTGDLAWAKRISKHLNIEVPTE